MSKVQERMFSFEDVLLLLLLLTSGVSKDWAYRRGGSGACSGRFDQQTLLLGVTDRVGCNVVLRLG